MMDKQREIKFRGRRRMDGEWVYGYYVEREDCNHGMIYDLQGLGTKVRKETVGQYVGLPDEKGKEIYEGDIVDHNGELTRKPLEVKYIDGAFCLGLKGLGGENYLDSNDYATIRDLMFNARWAGRSLELRIVGNKHEKL